LFLKPHSLNAVVVGTTVVGVVEGGHTKVVVVSVGARVEVIVVVGVGVTDVDVMETGTSPVVVVVEGASVVVGLPVVVVVVITEPHRSEGMVAGTQEVVAGSHVAFFMVEEEEHEYVTIVPAFLVAPSQSDVAPEGAAGGSSEHSREHVADMVLSTPIPPPTVHSNPPPCTHCLVVDSVLIK